MKKIIVDVTTNEVVTNGQTCNLIEAGLCPDGSLESLVSKDEIQEHLEGQGYEVSFRYNDRMYADEFETHFDWNPMEDEDMNIDKDAYFTIDDNGTIAAVNVGNQRFGTFEV